jgi:hypothetical protein
MITDPDTPMRTGGCHCGAVRFEVDLVDGLHTARRCDCSFCRMRGAVAVSGRPGGLRILSGADQLTCYRFNTGAARHFFCSCCGIYTHHERRSRPGEYGVNLACLDGLSPFDLLSVDVLDGVRHPMDLPPGEGPRIAGRLVFILTDPVTPD